VINKSTYISRQLDGVVWTMGLWARIQYAVSDGVQELLDGIGMAVL
jgi:hypothetical protein